jgi:serine/threonine-protein kinase
MPPTLRQSEPSPVGVVPEQVASWDERESDLSHLPAGEQLAGRFTIVRFVARGGIGAVYEASDVVLRTRVALKMLEGRITDDTEAMERFRREVLLARRVTHPNVCRVYELYQATTAAGAPVHFLTMEFLEGETLAAQLEREGRFTTAESLPLVQQMCEGLAAAHAEGVVHRDFKSGNVMLVPRAGEAGRGAGRVVITDFGVARALEPQREADSLTGGAAILGTPEYMAPEQVTGSDVSPATDVYALGVVLYEMVTGSLPFTADSPLATAARRIDVPPPRPELAAPGLDTRWSRTILRCLDRDPRRRFQHAPDVAVALASTRRRRRWPLALGGAALLLLAVGVGVRVGRAPAPVAAPQAKHPSIAVLAFADMSPGHDQEYFSDGVAQEIIHALEQVPGLNVVARSSSFAFKGKNEDLRTVGQKLGVASILEGSVRKASGRLRVTAQLVSAADGYQLWSQTFDRDLSDVFAVQDEVARAVVSALRMRVKPEWEGMTPEFQVTKPEVYAIYLQGLQTSRSANSPKAVDEFKKAIALDPDYAPAHAELANALIDYGSKDGSSQSKLSTSDWRREAIAEAEKAVALNPRLPQAYLARGFACFFIRWDWPGALRDIERALALAPSNAQALQRYARLLLRLGRAPEGLEAAKKAVALDPLAADAFGVLGDIYRFLGQYAAARVNLENAVALAPERAEKLKQLGELELLDGHPEKALTIFGRSPLFRRNPMEWVRQYGAAMAEHSLGNEAASRRALEQLIASYAEKGAYNVAEAYAWRGERDLAFEWLERAYQGRDPGLIEIKGDPLIGSVRSDPRYAALLAKLKLPPD